MPEIMESHRKINKLVELEEEMQSYPDTVFGFLEDAEFYSSSDNSWNPIDDFEDEDDENSSCSLEESKAFWEEQDKLLQKILCRSSSLETKIRQATKEAMKGLKMLDSQCNCQISPSLSKECRNCLQKSICNRLVKLGYDCGFYISKWKSSSEIPSGKHTYLEVIDKSNPKKQIRVIIEFNLRAEFEMAKASEEYNFLVSRLPEVYVGKSKRLRSVINVLCLAANKCIKDKKLHLGPWRKQKYMQAKWLGSCQRSSSPGPLPVRFPDRLPRARTSMLTFDLLETNKTVLQRKVVEVL